MGNASADEYQPAGNDIRSDDAAGDAGKQTTQQGMLEKVYCNSSNKSIELYSVVKQTGRKD